MIVCTKNNDTLCKQAFGGQHVGVADINTIIQNLMLDPKLGSEKKDAFVISNEDIKSPRFKQSFIDAVATKHKEVIVCLVARTGKPCLAKGNGVDLVLIKPKADELADRINEVIGDIAAKEDIISSADEEPIKIQEYKTRTEKETKHKKQEEEPTPVVSEPEEFVLTFPQSTPQEEVQPKETDELAKRIEACSRVADLSLISRELTADKLVKDVLKSNQEYITLEEQLHAIQEKIFSVIADASTPNVSDKLAKIHAVLYDKKFYESKGNTIIEQYVQNIIQTLTGKMKELLDVRLNQLDAAIKQTISKGDCKSDYTYERLAGITDERANVLLELAATQKELKDIFVSADNITMGVVSNIADKAANITGNVLLDAQVRCRGGEIVNEVTLDSLASLLASTKVTKEEFEEADQKVVVMQQKLNKLLDLDKEAIAAQSAIIEYLRSNNIQDSIVANTLLKKSLRIYTGESNCGRTVVPLVVATAKSRQNANTLVIDVTGESKLKDYGMNVIPLDEWVENRVERDLCFVEGVVKGSPEAAQRFSTVLTKAADHYRVINIIMDIKQKDLFDNISDNALCVNYVTEASVKTLDSLKEVITETKKSNVAQRVIVNKWEGSCSKIIDRLGLADTMDVSMLQVPYIQQIVDCGLSGTNPTEIDCVREGFREVIEHA